MDRAARLVSLVALKQARAKQKRGEPGAPGRTPVKGIDYGDGRPGYSPQKGKDYNDGNPGKDGIGIARVSSALKGRMLTLTIHYTDGRQQDTQVELPAPQKEHSGKVLQMRSFTRVAEGGTAQTQVKPTSSYTVASTSIGSVLASGTFPVYLPDPASRSGPDQRLLIKNIGSGTITATASGGTMDGLATIDLAEQYKGIMLESDGANWWIV